MLFKVKNCIAFLAIVFAGSTLFAQESDTTLSTSPAEISISFTQDGSVLLFNPGARVGLDLPLIEKRVFKTKDSSTVKVIDKTRLLSGRLSWYHHNDFHDNLYLTVGYKMRRENEKGFFTEFTPEIGLSRTFLGGKTYEVDDRGNVTVKNLAGYFYPTVAVGAGLGHNFQKSHQRPIRLFSCLNLLALFPYNSTIFLRPSVELGVVFCPSDFISSKVISKTVNK